jgi:3-methyladenine DNA glycosylase AlkD
MTSINCETLLKHLKSLSRPESLAGMSRFGINTKNAYGVSVPELRKIARKVGKNHLLAQQLWASGIHDARILAGMVDEPEKVTEKQMECWVKDFDSWDVCDGCCNNLFHKTSFAHAKAAQWSRRREEFVKRAGFTLMAVLAVHDKAAQDATFQRFFPLIQRGATDPRNFVKKAVNWALRQIGKRNRSLNEAAVQAARKIPTLDSKSAKWIAADALRELTSEAVQKRLRG